MTVLHLATWFPEHAEDSAGIFIEKHIEAISRYDTRNTHLVIPLSHRFTGIQQPLQLVQQFEKKARAITTPKRNYTVTRLQFFITHAFLKGPVGEQLYRQVRHYIKSNKLQIGYVHAHVTYTAGYVAMRLLEDEGIPYQISEHMSPFPFMHMRTPGFISKNIARPLNKAEHISGVSTHLKKEILDYVNPGKRVDVIPNVVEHELIGTNNLNPIFSFVLIGHLTVQKGVDILIESVKILSNQTTRKFKIVIGGNGPEFNKLVLLSQQLDVADYFEWKGSMAHSEVLRLINQCHAFVCSSRHESFGVAVVEALSLGKPVVATNCGGTADTINIRNGILVKTENPESLAEGMHQMMRSYQQFNKIEIEEETRSKYSMKAVGAMFYDWQIQQ